MSVDPREYLAAAIAYHNAEITSISGSYPVSAIRSTVEEAFGLAFEPAFFEAGMDRCVELGWAERYDDPYNEPHFDFSSYSINVAWKQKKDRTSVIFRTRRIGKPWLMNALTALSIEPVGQGNLETPEGTGANRVISVPRQVRESASKGLKEIIEQLEVSNSAADKLGSERERIIAELTAGRELLDRETVRLGALNELIFRPLQYLIVKFVDGTIAAVATIVVASLAGVI